MLLVELVVTLAPANEDENAALLATAATSVNCGGAALAALRPQGEAPASCSALENRFAAPLLLNALISVVSDAAPWWWWRQS